MIRTTVYLFACLNYRPRWHTKINIRDNGTQIMRLLHCSKSSQLSLDTVTPLKQSNHFVYKLNTLSWEWSCERLVEFNSVWFGVVRFVSFRFAMSGERCWSSNNNIVDLSRFICFSLVLSMLVRMLLTFDAYYKNNKNGLCASTVQC